MDCWTNNLPDSNLNPFPIESLSVCLQPKVIPVVGLIGGVGSGKSSVAQRLRTLRPVAIIDADQIGHQVLTFPNVKAQIQQRFGSTILDSQGDISRSMLGRLVFGADESAVIARQDLQAIVWPAIGTEAVRQVGSLREQHQVEAILLDAAVLLEAGWKNACDLVVFIETPETKRLDRVTKNRGWTDDELTRREASQWSLPRKRAAADAIIDNSNSSDDAAKQLNDVITTFQIRMSKQFPMSKSE